MKQWLAIFLSLAMILAVTACGTAQPDNGPESKAEQSESGPRPNTESKADSSEESVGTKGRSLVVYFSWSGNTKRVAQSIQQQTGSDIFEIVPKTPYSTDYNTLVDDAKLEQQKKARPEISTGIDNIADYDTIYVGFPNWWGDMPMILYTFFDTYDLSGKTVALFCTSGGSGLSNTVNEVKALEPNAEVVQGLHIGSGASTNPDSAVRAWLDEIGTVR